MPSRRPGPSQTSTQESTTQGDEEQRFAEVGIIYIDGIFTFFHLTIKLEDCYVFIDNFYHKYFHCRLCLAAKAYKGFDSELECTTFRILRDIL